MLNNINFKTFYSTASDNIPESFYNLALSEAISYDRVSGYFSGLSLAYYSKGLASLLEKRGKFRLIISEEISEKDYENIIDGYQKRNQIANDLVDKIRYQDLPLEQQMHLSNLSYLIEIGLVDIKIGFTHSGLFHAKYGIFKDEAGNLLYFSGSLNETEAAFKKNYEEIAVLKSWKIESSELCEKSVEFENLWNNSSSDGRIFVKSINEIVKLHLITYSKGKIVVEKVMLEENSLILYFDQKLKLQNNLSDGFIDMNQRTVKQLIAKKYIDKQFSKFTDNLTHIEVEEIVKIVQRYSKRTETKVVIADTVYQFIKNSKFEIEEVAKRGLSIKHQDEFFKDKFEYFKNIVNAEVSRPLYEIQNWISFYQTMMRRSANFSVPGAGKTSMVYGTFAYLSSKEINEVDKIIVIGPKNSFLSWKDEYKSVFRGKRELNVLDIHAQNFTTDMMYRNVSLYNLILINYESLPSYSDALSKIIDERTYLVFDEVHKIKRIDSERSQTAIDLSQNAKYRTVLTGTPIPNTYQDIWNFLHILYNFEYNRYFGFTRLQLNSLSFQEIQEINSKLSPFFWRLTKQQLEIPQENPDRIISSTASFEEQQVINLLWKKFGHSPFKLYIRLIQASSNPELLKKNISNDMYGDYGTEDAGELDEILDDTPRYLADELNIINSLSMTTKFDACLKLSNSLISQGKKHIIWCIFIDTINKLEESLKKNGHQVAVVYGAISSEEREKIIVNFQQGKYDILITNPHTLAESVSLHMVAHDAIYYEYSFNLTHMLQSRDRIHRLGLPDGQETNYYYLMLNGQEGLRDTIDLKIYNRLNEKQHAMIEAIEPDSIAPEFSINERQEILEMMNQEFL